MQIPKNIIVKSAAGKTVAFLSPKADGLKECYADTRLNGESMLEFMLPATSEKLEYITPECEIWAGDKVFILRKNEAVDIIREKNNRLWAKVMAVEKWHELDYSYVEPSISNDPTARPPADLAVIIVGGGSNLSGNLHPVGTAAHALYVVLQGSGWAMGTVDVDGIRDLESEKISRLELIKMIQDIWGGYLVWDSVNKTVSLRDAGKWQPYVGFQVKYRKNLEHITRTQSNKLVTKLYPFGHDDLDIAAVNDGKKYITNHSYTDRVYVGIYKNQDIYSQDELLEKGTAELELICRPRYLYRVKLVDLRTLPEYSHEDFELGDMVDVIDPDIAPDDPRPRLIRHKYNIFQPWKCEFDMGDPEERLIEQLKASFNTTGFVGGKFNGSGEMSGHSIEHDTITAKHIKTGSIEIGHLDSSVAEELDLLENTVFSSYAADVDSRFGSHATLIQQNASEISLQAASISGLGTDIASLNIRAAGIESNVSSLSTTVTENYSSLDGKITSLTTTVTDNHSSITQTAASIQSNVTSLSTTVSGLDTTVSSHSSSISQLANEISSVVSFTDVTGNEVISRINQTATTYSISADKIDLTGVTSIYSPNANTRLEMHGGYLSFYTGNTEYMYITYDAIAGMQFWAKEFFKFVSDVKVSNLAASGEVDFRYATDIKGIDTTARFG